MPIKMINTAILMPFNEALMVNAAELTKVEVTILEQRLVCNPDHKAKMKTITSGGNGAINGDKEADNQLVKPISLLVNADPMANVPAHINNELHDTPLAMALAMLSIGFPS